jgi:hypothetical protein
MLSAYKSVRIISRKQRELLQLEVPVVPFAKTEYQIESEIARTVASWIEERRETVKEFARSNSVKELRGLGAT